MLNIVIYNKKVKENKKIEKTTDCDLIFSSFQLNTCEPERQEKTDKNDEKSYDRQWEKHYNNKKVKFCVTVYYYRFYIIQIRGYIGYIYKRVNWLKNP